MVTSKVNRSIDRKGATGSLVSRPVERALSAGGYALHSRPFVAERPQSNPDLTPRADRW